MIKEPGSGSPKTLWEWIGALTPLAKIGLGIAVLIVGGGVAKGGVVVVNNFGSGSSSSHSTGTSGASVSTPTPTPTPPPTSVVVYYSGSVGLAGNGLDFDLNPPQQGSANIYPLYGNTSEVATSTQGVEVSRYSGSPNPPGELDCRNWALTHGSGSVSAVQGDVLCFITHESRTVLFTVTKVINDSTGLTIDGTATVWNAPPA